MKKRILFSAFCPRLAMFSPLLFSQESISVGDYVPVKIGEENKLASKGVNRGNVQVKLLQKSRGINSLDHIIEQQKETDTLQKQIDDSAKLNISNY